MSRAKSALDAMQRIETPKGSAPPPQLLITFNERTYPVFFACFLRDAWQFGNEYLLLVFESVKYHDAPQHILIPALHTEDARDYLQVDLRMPPADADRLIGMARAQEKQFNARARALKPPEPPVPCHIPDVTDDAANPPPTAEQLAAEMQRLEGRRQTRAEGRKP